MVKVLVSDFAAFVLLLSSTGFAFAAEPNNNTDKAKDLLVEQGYTEEEAFQFLENMTISSEGTLVGIDLLNPPESKSTSLFRAAPLTSTQILTHEQVRVIFNNLNLVGTGSTWLGIAVGLKYPILGAVIGVGGLQNSNLRNAITQAYYQGKRVKIVPVYGSSMSLNEVHYYVID